MAKEKIYFKLAPHFLADPHGSATEKNHSINGRMWDIIKKVKDNPETLFTRHDDGSEYDRHKSSVKLDNAAESDWWWWSRNDLIRCDKDGNPIDETHKDEI